MMGDYIGSADDWIVERERQTYRYADALIAIVAQPWTWSEYHTKHHCDTPLWDPIDGNIWHFWGPDAECPCCHGCIDSGQHDESDRPCPWLTAARALGIAD